MAREHGKRDAIENPKDHPTASSPHQYSSPSRPISSPSHQQSSSSHQESSSSNLTSSSSHPGVSVRQPVQHADVSTAILNHLAGVYTRIITTQAPGPSGTHPLFPNWLQKLKAREVEGLLKSLPHERNIAFSLELAQYLSDPQATYARSFEGRQPTAKEKLEVQESSAVFIRLFSDNISPEISEFVTSNTQRLERSYRKGQEQVYANTLQELISFLETKMGRNNQVIRHGRMTNKFFNQHPTDGDCDCASCQLHPTRKLSRRQMEANKAAMSKENPAPFCKFLWDQHPELTEKVNAEVQRTGRGVWTILGELVWSHIEAGENPMLTAAMDALEVYYKEKCQDGALDAREGRKESLKSIEPEDNEDVLDVMAMLCLGIKSKSQAQVAEIMTKMNLQDEIIQDEKKNEHERLIAEIEKRRLGVERDNIHIRIMITSARLFNADKRFGSIPEDFAKVMIEHLKLPGGTNEDFAGMMKAMKLSSSKKITKVPVPLNKYLNEPILAAEDIPEDVAGPSSSKGNQKNNKGKGKETAAKPSEPKVDGGPMELQNMFQSHDDNMRHVEALTKVFEWNMKRAHKASKRPKKNKDKAAPPPAAFNFKGLPVPTEDKRIPKDIIASIWDYDYLLEEIQKEERKVTDLRNRITVSIYSWSCRTTDEQWAELKPRAHNLPLVLEYAVERTLLIDDIMDAYCECLRITRFFQTEKGQEIKLPEELAPKLFAMGKTVADVELRWRKYLVGFYSTKEDLLDRLDRIRSGTEEDEEEMKAEKTAGEEEGKEWWRVLVPKRA